MLGLFLSLWLAGEPPAMTPAADSPTASADAPSRKRRLSKGRRLTIGAGVAFGIGSAIQWGTAGATGMLGDARPGATSAVTLGMNLGGIGMLEGLIIGTIGARELARERHGHDHRAKPMLAGGSVLAGLGGAAILGGALFWPTIRAKCPIGAGCSLAAMHLGGAALSVGTGMISYGHTLRQRDDDFRPLSKKARSPLIAGSVLLGTGYVLSAGFGLAVWQDDPADRVAIRTRNRMLIPVVGPWIHAAGPDAPLFIAMVTGVLGAVQIGGAVALAVGGGIAGVERRRTRERVQVAVVPSFDGVSIVGRF